jgi:metal-dependent amidase/aminoacylase/carboxypeptidase family protein
MTKLMADHRGQWAGTLIPLFQPAEETGDGAQGMVDDGLFQRIPVSDVALTQHVLPGIAGMVSTRSGPFMATEDSINVTVYGKGGHGAMPQHAIDPVVLAARRHLPAHRQRPGYHGPGGGRLRHPFWRPRPRNRPADRQRGLQ